MDPDTDVCQTEQPQISYSVDFTAEQSSAMGSPILLDREGRDSTRVIENYEISICEMNLCFKLLLLYKQGHTEASRGSPSVAAS